MSTAPRPDARPPESPEDEPPCGGVLCDLLTAATVFALLGGLLALWLGAPNLAAGGLAALASGAAGFFFAKG